MIKFLLSVLFFVFAASVVQAAAGRTEAIISCIWLGRGHGDPSMRQDLVISTGADQSAYTGRYLLSFALNDSDSSDWRTQEILSGSVNIEKGDGGAIRVDGALNFTIVDGEATFQGATYSCDVATALSDHLPDAMPFQDDSFTVSGFGGHREDSESAYEDMWDNARRHCASPVIISDVRSHTDHGNTFVSAEFTCSARRASTENGNE